MKTDDKKDNMIMGALYQALLMLLTASKLTDASAWLKGQMESKGYDVTNSLEEVGTNLFVGSGGMKKGKDTLIRYLANTIGLHVGKVFYTVKAGGGFNANLAKSTAIAILHHIGLTDDKGVLLSPDTLGNDASKFAKDFSLAFIQPVEESTSTGFGGSIDDPADGDDEDDEDEFDNVEVVSATDSVVSFNPLTKEARDAYPLMTVFMSFFEMIKSCGSAVGTVLNYATIHPSGKLMNWRRGNVDEAIANGDATYINGKNQTKDLRCVSYFSTAKKIDNMCKHSFSYTMVLPILLRSFGFNYNNRKQVFEHMVDTYMNGEVSKGQRFVVAGMRLIMNAVDNGANAQEVGVGFAKYLNAKDIYAIVDKYTDNGEFFDAIKGTSKGGSKEVDISFDDLDVLA